jgi:hypothetical protein
MGNVMRHLLLVRMFIYSSLWAQEQAYTPQVGSTERKAVLGALASHGAWRNCSHVVTARGPTAARGLVPRCDGAD